MPRALCSVEECPNPRHSRDFCNRHYKRWKRHGNPLAPSRENYGRDFWDYVDRSPEGCWEWQAYRDPNGYGRVYAVKYGFRPSSLAHRVAWALTHGELNDQDCVLHHCDNPPCVRPEHLFLGTKADNTADMMAKGRGTAGAQPFRSRTHGTRNAHAKLTEELVVEMRQRAQAGERYQVLAAEYGISESRANAIIIGNGWRHVWPYNKG